MPLGYRGHTEWRDMSEYVVHFTRTTDDGDALDNILGILGDLCIRPSGPFGWAKGLGALGESQKSACFSEIPLDRLDRLVDRRSRYGVGFHQRTLLDAGGARVWYVDRRSPSGEILNERLHAAISKWADDLWRMTPFIDQPYDTAVGGYRFEWEREWRVPGGLTFTPADVAFVFAHNQDHGTIAGYIDQFLDWDHTPPVIDPLWTDDQIQDALDGVG